MSSKRILHVTSELYPYFEENPISTTVNHLAKKSYQAGNDVRVFMPKFGFINERRFQLHEVIRLSGINLIINDLDQPLVIKVASLPGERMQVYFVDNEEYFKRKAIYHDEKNEFFPDNHERAIFFVKGVLETVKKLNWVPDIIHVHGWMAAFLPIYIKTYYQNDAIFKDCKIITSVYNHLNDTILPKELEQVLKFDGIDCESCDFLSDNSIKKLVNKSVLNSDLIIKGEEFLAEELESFIDGLDGSKSDYSFLEELQVIYEPFIKEGVSINQLK